MTAVLLRWIARLLIGAPPARAVSVADLDATRAELEACAGRAGLSHLVPPRRTGGQVSSPPSDPPATPRTAGPHAA